MKRKPLLKKLLIISILVLGINTLYAQFSSSSADTYLVSMLIVFLVAVIAFLLFREIMCWYWKINQIVTLLKEIKDNTSSPDSRLRQDHLEKQRSEYKPPNRTQEKAKEVNESKKIQDKKEDSLKKELDKKFDDEFLKY